MLQIVILFFLSLSPFSPIVQEGPVAIHLIPPPTAISTSYTGYKSDSGIQDVHFILRKEDGVFVLHPVASWFVFRPAAVTKNTTGAAIITPTDAKEAEIRRSVEDRAMEHRLSTMLRADKIIERDPVGGSTGGTGSGSGTTTSRGRSGGGAGAGLGTNLAALTKDVFGEDGDDDERSAVVGSVFELRDGSGHGSKGGGLRGKGGGGTTGEWAADGGVEEEALASGEIGYRVEEDWEHEAHHSDDDVDLGRAEGGQRVGDDEDEGSDADIERELAKLDQKDEANKEDDDGEEGGDDGDDEDDDEDDEEEEEEEEEEERGGAAGDRAMPTLPGQEGVHHRKRERSEEGEGSGKRARTEEGNVGGLTTTATKPGVAEVVAFVRSRGVLGAGLLELKALGFSNDAVGNEELKMAVKMAVQAKSIVNKRVDNKLLFYAANL